MRPSSLLLAFLGGVSLSTAAPNPPVARGRVSGHRSLVARDTCPAPEDVLTEAPKANPFSAITPEELASVVGWLTESSALALNLTNSSSPELSISDNYIAHIEILKPNKTDVLSYLYGDGQVPRYARVILNHGAAEVPHVAEYSVGPLPIDCNTKLESLDWMYNGPNGAKVLFNGRFMDSAFGQAIDILVNSTMMEINDIVEELTGFAFYGRGDERTTGSYFITNPYSTDGTTGVGWTVWRKAGLASYGRPSELYMSWDFAGNDPSLWKLRMIVYDLKVYHSTAEFRSAWEAGNISKTPSPSESDEYLRKDRKGPVRELENRLAPTMLNMGGKRFKIDKKNSYIEYMGFKFYMRFDRDVGIQFYDIKFMDERVMYELSLQDAIAQYAGHNPFQAATAYMDRFYGIGLQAGRLVPGYDCPYGATYLNTTYSQGETIFHQPGNICIFEADIGTPITRHAERQYLQSTKGSKLVVRMIATVGNYDYLWDYGFYVDGTITVDAHASGYVQANDFRPDDNGQWGPRISDQTQGTLHSHVMNFKVDFDLIDENNSFLKTNIIVENVTQPWFPERGEFEMMRYDFEEVNTEALLPITPNGQTMYTVVNKNHKNKWGEPRGYRILPGLSNVVLPSKLSPFFLKSAEFAKQPIAVSRHHDTEPASSASLNQNVPEAPLVEFWKFFDGEDIAQKDLVAWVNLGMQHYTRSEDMPNTLMSEAHSSIMFAPQNWGDSELTQDLQNAVIYNEVVGEDVAAVVANTNGVQPPSCMALGPEDSLVGIFEAGAVDKPAAPHNGYN